jgi:alpha-amylase
MDGHDELLADTGAARLAFKPSDGGHLFEFDLVEKTFNALAALTRRREAYHRAVLANHVKATAEAGTASIHDTVRLRDPEVRHKIVYDWYKKESLIDHFFGPETELKSLSKCRYKELGDFVNMPYEVRVEGKADAVSISLKRDGALWLDDGKRPLKVEKVISLERSSPEFTVAYLLTNENVQELSLDFGVEFNLALLGGKAHDRYYLAGRNRENLGNLSTFVDAASLDVFAAVDEWKGVEWWLEFSQAAALWAFPVETASMSEFGVELVYQCSSVIPHWRIKLAPGGTWNAKITFAPRLR